jgi:hypothetical protein
LVFENEEVTVKMSFVNDLLNDRGLGVCPLHLGNVGKFEQYWVCLNKHFYVIEYCDGFQVAYNCPLSYVTTFAQTHQVRILKFCRCLFSPFVFVISCQNKKYTIQTTVNSPKDGCGVLSHKIGATAWSEARRAPYR